VGVDLEVADPQLVEHQRGMLCVPLVTQCRQRSCHRSTSGTLVQLLWSQGVLRCCQGKHYPMAKIVDDIVDAMITPF